MAENVKETGKVQNEVVNTVAVQEPATMEFRLINPTEDGFLRVIKWNKEELEAAVKQKIADYENVVYTEENIQQAKNDRAELNKLTKAIEDRRKEIKKKINEPYDIFEKELKEVLALIEKPVGMIDRQIKDFEDQQKEEKKASIKKTYDEVIGDLAEVLPFEKVFDSRYLNKTYKITIAQEDVKRKVDKVRTDLETIDGLDSKYKLNVKDVYIKTFDLSKALAENKRLSDLEEKLEAERKRKAEEEAERKLLEEKFKKREEERKAKESQKEKEESEKDEPITQNQSVSEDVENGTIHTENKLKWVSEPIPLTVMEKVNSNIEHQAFSAAADPFTQKMVADKKFRTRFCAVGTRSQLEGLVRYMQENGIEYERI